MPFQLSKTVTLRGVSATGDWWEIVNWAQNLVASTTCVTLGLWASQAARQADTTGSAMITGVTFILPGLLTVDQAYAYLAANPVNRRQWNGTAIVTVNTNPFTGLTVM